MAVNPLCEGYPRVIPYLICENANKTIEFLTNVLEAEVTERVEQPEGTLMHAEVRLGDSMVMLAQACEQWPANQAMLYVYVPDVDATYKRGLEAGATSTQEPTTQFYGDRTAMLIDASGIQWSIASHVEDLTPGQLQERLAQYSKNGGAG